MYQLLVTSVILFLFIGCSSKEQKILHQNYEKNKAYHKALQKSEKTQLYAGQYTKAMLTATYISKRRINLKDEKDEVFIVAIHLEDDNTSLDTETQIEDINTSLDADTENNSTKSKKVVILDPKKFYIELNGKKPKEIKALDKSDILLKDVSFISDWSQVYLVTFPYISRRTFVLSLKSNVYGKGVLHFSKVAKYVSKGTKSIF